MAYSTQEVVSDGTLVLLDIAIDYFDRDDLTFYFDDVPNAYPWAWVGTTQRTISFSPAIPNGVVVLVRRTTDISQPRHIFTLGAKFTTQSVDEDLKQVLQIAQEAKEGGWGESTSELRADLALPTGGTLVGHAPDTGGNTSVSVELRTHEAELTALHSSIGASLVGYTPQGTGAVASTVQTKLHEFVSVKDFGAVGDGVTDDSAAIQLAANAASGKVLLFPAGNYVVHNGFDFSGDNSHIEGYGAVLIYNATSASYYHCIRIFGNDCSVSGIKIKTNSALVRDDTGFGISAGNISTATTGLLIKDCVFDAIASAAIWVSNVTRVRVVSNYIHDCKADGIHFSDGCFDVVCSNNVLMNQQDDHIAVVNDTSGAPLTGDISIIGNVIVGGSVGGHGVALIGVIGGVVSGNNISATVAAAIGTYSWTDPSNYTSGLLISNNVINNCGASGATFGGAGINLQETGAVTIRGNTIHDIAYDGAKTCGGIRVISASEAVIADNHLYNMACDGVVYSASSSNVSIVNNSFGYGTRTPILVSGGVTRCTVAGNQFNDNAATNDIDINTPSGQVFISNNRCGKGISLVSSNTGNITRDEMETFTSTITAASGSITTASGTIYYNRRGRFIDIVMSVVITTNGTGAGSVDASLPFTVTSGVLHGRENGVSGKTLHAVPSGASVQIRNYDNTYPGASGASMTLSGILQIS